MSDWLCKNCGEPMRILKSGEPEHYDSPACSKPEFTTEDADILDEEDEA